MWNLERTTHVTEEVKSITGDVIKIRTPIFNKEDEERAKTIVSALEGMTIESAQALLSKVNLYLLQEIVH
uniref:hypothetical protein n=1 Tax=Enterocloster clostridioformis TaxID=1531 RepID=UPI00266DBDFA|nr:hypothetical protein [Enterocloster clostridioformis]